MDQPPLKCLFSFLLNLTLELLFRYVISGYKLDLYICNYAFISLWVGRYR